MGPFMYGEAIKTPESKKITRLAHKLSKRQRAERRPSKPVCMVFEVPQPISAVEYLIYGGSK